MKKSLKRRWRGDALITGGAQRIGRAVALHLASLNYRVALHYHGSLSAAQATAAMIRKSGGICEIFPANLADGNETVELFSRVITRFPKLNLLINNASIFEPSRLQNTSVETLDRHFAVNFRAPYILIGEFAKACKAGQIINMLDTNIVKNKTTYAAYLLSKKSLAELTKLAAVELAPRIRVNAVAPGFILPPAGNSQVSLSHLLAAIPLKRQGTVAHIGQAIRFLLENDYVTGQILFADGGKNLV